MTADLHICIDLALSDENSARENNSLAIQIRNAYGVIRKSEIPVALHLASLAPGGCIAEVIAKQNCDAWHIHRHAEDVEDAFAPSELVFLSPDADEPLDAVVPGKVYVIGGVVDKNIKRKITLGKAQEHDIPAYRLPVREIFPSCRNTVLNVDSVVQALCVFAAHRDWQVALRGCVPLRKLSADAAAALGAEQGGRWRRRKEKEQQIKLRDECRKSGG
ncbi:TRMT10B [Symbiodinium microadriaticum]|nr:TRMT10B [Symbiodinium microadriaticum]